MAALRVASTVSTLKRQVTVLPTIFTFRRKFRDAANRKHKRLSFSHIFLIVVSILFIFDFRFESSTYYNSTSLFPPRKYTNPRNPTTSLNYTVRLYQRYTVPWRKYPDLWEENYNPGLSPEQSRNRFFVATAGEDEGDGLGHRFLTHNYERILADALNLTYVHRQSRYGSLTALQRSAVDDFFGWSNEPNRLHRHSFFKKICDHEKHVQLSVHCVEKLIVCAKPRHQNGMVDKIVTIPPEVIFCPRVRFGSDRCRDILQAFIAKHPEPNTLFHTPDNLCSWKVYWSDQRITRGWHYNRYWRAKRESKFDPRFVNIAVHIRRGDFLTSSNRVSISDVHYARTIRQVVSLISEIENNAELSDNKLVFKVHIYSQGLFKPHIRNPLLRFIVKQKGFFGDHDVNHYGTKYVSEEGVETEEGYWTKLLGNHSRIHPELHISEDTLESLEHMIAADVFIGSTSGLSIHIAAQLSRGIPFLPIKHPPSVTSDMTIQWYHERRHDFAFMNETEIDDSYFDREHFRKVWMIYREHIGADKVPLGVNEEEIYKST